MALWPFKRRRDSSANAVKDPDSAHRPRQRSFTDPHTSQSAPWSPPRDSADAAAPAPDIPRHSEKPGRDTFSSRTQLPYSPTPHKLDVDLAEDIASPRKPAVPGKENITPLNNASREDITALPISSPLPTSPHLRPADLLRSPRIPYSFHHQPSPSRGSTQRGQTSDGRTSTMRSRKSGFDASSTPGRRLSKRQDTALREEEIRAMSAPMPIPIPKRPGDGPLRRDSKKLRALAAKESNVSLPAPDSVHSSMAAVVEQRGWEVGIMDVFNPRPLVRLSGAPQYVHTGLPPTVEETKEKQKKLRTDDEKSKDMSKKKQSSSRKSKRRQKIGAAVDDLNASELRAILERDAKRKEDRERSKQEKLDRKLRRRAESDIRRQRTEEAAMTADERQRAEELRRLRGLMTPPTDVHPALRDHENPFELENPFEPAEPDAEDTQHSVGLGIERDGSVTPTGPRHDDRFVTPAASVDYQRSIQPQASSEWSADADGYHTPLEEPMEYEDSVVQDDTITDLVHEERQAQGDTTLDIDTLPEEDESFILNTAQVVRLSQTVTPPISPVNSKPQLPTTLSQVEAADSLESKPVPATYQPTTSAATRERNLSDVREKRNSGWTSFFRRSTSRKVEDPPVTGFVNTSRESMRNASIPAHLVDVGSRSQTSIDRRSSGTPARTQSKFREDLPEIPISPTDSSSAPSEVAAAARRAGRLRQAEGVPEGAEDGTERSGSALARNDTPMTPRRGPTSLSIGSVGSEGSWLASSSVKRKRDTAIIQGPGLLGRNPNFVASYEELGEDKDAEYVHSSRPELAGEPPSEATSPLAISSHIIEQDANTPLTVGKSARRRPTISEAPDIPASQGIVAEIARVSGHLTPDQQSVHQEEPEMWGQESPAPQLHSATSINYRQGHARQISAGSAKVLDIPRRTSLDTAFTRTPISPVSPATTVRYSTLSEGYNFPHSRDEPQTAAGAASEEHS